MTGIVVVVHTKGLKVLANSQWGGIMVGIDMVFLALISGAGLHNLAHSLAHALLPGTLGNRWLYWSSFQNIKKINGRNTPKV